MISQGYLYRLQSWARVFKIPFDSVITWSIALAIGWHVLIGACRPSMGGNAAKPAGGNLGRLCPSFVYASRYGAPPSRVVGGRHIMVQMVMGGEHHSTLDLVATLFLPTLCSNIAGNHPKTYLLGFSGALAL